MYAAQAVPLESGRLADVGSGGGFPGLALKIIRPGLRVYLVESNIKKVTFLAEVIRELGLRDAQVLARRYEELGEEVAPLDYVCSRALGEFPAFLEWARSEQIAAKQVILWIGARDLPEIQKITTWTWRDPIPVPHSLRRLLLVGTKAASDVKAAS
jgi:16S rRNA (guanine(527)-N(7))-methyltransferase RsmG